MREIRRDGDKRRDSQTPEQMKTALADVFIRRRRTLFEMSGNGAHVIAASRIVHYFGVSTPPWLSAARDRMDKSLLSSSSVKDVAPAMALHAAGGAFATKRASTEERNLAICDMVDLFKALKAGEIVDPEPCDADDRRAQLELRSELELDGVFAAVGRRFELSAERVQEIYYDTIASLKA